MFINFSGENGNTDNHAWTRDSRANLVLPGFTCWYALYTSVAETATESAVVTNNYGVYNIEAHACLYNNSERECVCVCSIRRKLPIVSGWLCACVCAVLSSVTP